MDGSYKKYKEESGIINLQSQKALAALQCCYEMRASGKSSIKSEHSTILGCASPFVTARRYLLFITSNIRVGLNEDLNLLPAALVRTAEVEQITSLLIRTFGSRSETHISRLSRAEIQIVSVIARMFEVGELKKRSASEGELKLEYSSVLRPTVSLWAIILLHLLMITIFGSCELIMREASRLFPYSEIIGEDNLIRVWARSKQPRYLRAEPDDSSWLRIVKRRGEMRLEACVDEPVSQVFDKRIPLVGVR